MKVLNSQLEGSGPKTLVWTKPNLPSPNCSGKRSSRKPTIGTTRRAGAGPHQWGSRSGEDFEHKCRPIPLPSSQGLFSVIKLMASVGWRRLWGHRLGLSHRTILRSVHQATHRSRDKTAPPLFFRFLTPRGTDAGGFRDLAGMALFGQQPKSKGQ